MPKQKVNDISLYYETTGQGTPILLLHGLGSSGRDWAYQLPAFSPNYQVITLDIRGHGRSDKPAGPYSVAQFARDVATFIEQQHLAPVHIVGISMGGMIAFQLAVDMPALLRTITVVNAVPALIPRNLSERLQIWQRLILFRLFSMRRIGKVIGERLFPEPQQAQHQTQFIERWAENDKAAYMHATRALMGWSVAHHLQDIHTPTLLITADQDYTSIADKEVCVQQMPNAQLVIIPNSRHATPIDQPERFNEAVLRFLRTQGDAT